MAGMRLGMLVLVLLLALAPRPTSAQAPRAAPTPLIDLFADDTIAYLEVALRTGDGKGAPLDRLLADLLGQPGPAAQLGGLGLLPQLARAAAVGLAVQGEDPRLLVALAADDPALLLGLALRGDLRATPIEDYAGARLYRTAGSTPIFIAASGSYLLGSNDHDTLTATIDRARAGAAAPAGLAATPRYRATIARLPANRLVTGYVDGLPFLDWFEGAGAGEPRPGGVAPGRAVPFLPGGRNITSGITAGAAAQMAALQNAFQAGGAALAVSTVPEGLRSVVFWPDPGASAGAQTPSTSAALGLVPADALLAVTSFALGDRVREALAQAGTSLDQLGLPDLDLENTLLSWMDGEYGVALLPSGQDSPGVAAFPLPTVALLFEVRDPARADDGLRYLAARAAEAGLLPDGVPREERQAGVDVRRLPISEGLELTWGSLGRWVFVTTGSAGPLAFAGASGGLAGTPAYTSLGRQLPSPHTGVFYLQIGDTVRWIESLDSGPLARLSEDERWWSPLAARLGALVLTSALPRGGWQEQVGVLRIVQ